MDDLVTWLRAQLDDDERAIREDRDLGEQSTFPWHQMLDDIDAKRRILDWLEDVRRIADMAEVWGIDADDAVRLLALPFAGRDGWREEWRPQ